eukprot:SAG11_NODE_20610_length_441_cov_20.131579_1_plen_93_part_01
MPRGRKRKCRLGAIVRSGKARRGEASGDDESDSSLSDHDDRTPHRPASDEDSQNGEDDESSANEDDDDEDDRDVQILVGPVVLRDGDTLKVVE